MQNDTLTFFMDLILFDQSLLAYEDQLDVLYEEMKNIEVKKEKHYLQFVQKQQELKQLKESIKTCEDDLKASVEEEKKLQTAHKDVHDRREYIALKKELDHYHYVQETLEKKLLNAFAQVETVEKEYHLLEQQVEKDIQEIDTLLQECRNKIAAVENSFEEAKQKRSSLQDNIPVEWYTRYERMRQEVMDPISFVVEDSCSSCFQILTPADMIHIQQGPLTCKGCYRFLCIRPSKG